MQYYQKIDGLRCIAIIAVMIHHIASIFSTYIDWGYFGVDLFFVISGFLITSILLKTKGSFKTTYINFLARRSLRIFPLYYFAILVFVIIGHPVVLENIGYLLTYTFNYRYPLITQANPLGHFWSLSVEEQYYLFWPIIVLALRHHIKILVFVALAIITFAYSQIAFNIIPSISIYNYVGLPARMGSLGLGSIGAMFFMLQSQILKYILHNKLIEYSMFALWLVALVLLKPFLLGLVSVFMVMKAAQNSFHFQGFNWLLTHKFTLYIGKISYGLYVYHIIVIYYMTPYVFNPIWHSINFEAFGKLSVLKYHSWLIKLPLYFSVTIILSDLSYRYFEKPLLKLKRYFV
jgi:peptidoglycan/LPS O-acetylase OafA/YrhL